MKIDQITGTTDIAGSIAYIKNTVAELPIQDYKNQYDITNLRPINNPAIRPDKTVVIREDIVDAGKPTQRSVPVTKQEPVNRLAVPLQKRIVDATVSFTFGNPVELVCNPEENSVEAQILGAVNRILDDNKIDPFNRSLARELARCTQVAECWFPVNTNENNDHYGFDTTIKIKVQLFSPWDGNELFPVFDDTGDMVAFGRGFIRKESGKDIAYFEVYTDEQKLIWKQNEGSWTVYREEQNTLGKIPIVYYQQPEVEWHDVQSMIERFEKLKSNFGDTNDYFGSPILAISGDVVGLAGKGEQGKAVQLKNGAKIEYVEWEHGPEAVELEFNELRRDIFGMSQTPDLSFASISGILGNVSGIALRFLFSDAHQKVQNKREIYDPGLQRRLNILKAFVGVLNSKAEGWKKASAKLIIKPKINPYVINNEKDLVDLLMEATGGQPLVSQKTAVALSGLSESPDKEYQQLVREAADKQKATQESLFGATD